VTSFLPVSSYSLDGTFTHVNKDHPGGEAIILKYGGKDATQAFNAVHELSYLENYLSKEHHLGSVNLLHSGTFSATTQTKEQERVKKAIKERPPLNRMLSADDFEVSDCVERDLIN
jgi:L-lactate dehydrogenase (cytochrome)